ncbi:MULTISPECIES: hypothetical protein [Pseudomonas]|uniref:hypothetical protein n=1 Tax=Pseudomonas TaxID=286 RepID=UPI001AEB18B4|nr:MULTISPECIES: hypothetical protein [Pseudomonas]MBP2083523.1 hypothetical protein [Pseudomonas sp. PvP089]MBP2090774.1 hypothetical protein [Pseudomonas sp. PvP088]MBP2223062.1 hypothetical protein [Pseudomonas putida]
MVVWESVGGVFWRTPPTPVVVPEEVAPFPVSTFIYCGLLLAVVVPVLLRHISTLVRPEGLDLRRHLGLIGFMLTLAYFAVILPLIWGRLGTLGTMPLNEVGDFLAGAFGPVAFSWVVLGFVQQGEEIRMQSLESKKAEMREEIMAKIAVEQAEAQRMAMEKEHKRREREISADFAVSIRGVSNGTHGMVVNKIRLKNRGHRALNVVFGLGEPYIDCDVISVGHMDRNGEVDKEVVLPLTTGPVEGKLILSYYDVDDNERVETFRYTVENSRAEFTKD